MTDGEGIRLSRQVAAARGCSRREAEALIFSGAVQVDGLVVSDPARRIRHEHVQIEAAAAHPALQPLTLLVHQGGPSPVRAEMLGARFDGANADGLRNIHTASFRWFVGPLGGRPCLDYFPGAQVLNQSLLGQWSWQENAGMQNSKLGYKEGTEEFPALVKA